MAVRLSSPPDATGTLDVLVEGCERIRRAAAGAGTRRGRRPGQYAIDLAADSAVVPWLLAQGFGVLSEESGLQRSDRPVVMVVDPIDGSANAVRGEGPYGPSLCSVDARGLAAAAILDLTTGSLVTAVRRRGARRDGQPIAVSRQRSVAAAHVIVSGPLPSRPPWRTSTRLHATAHELTLVADGTVDAYLNTDEDHCAPWDYLAGSLICVEAGAEVRDVRDRTLLELDPTARRQPVAANPSLLSRLRA